MSEKEKKSGSRLNRRTFLKGVAATGAMGAIAAANPTFAEQSANQNNTAAKSWRDKPDPIDESQISDGGTYDVVVVGAGNSGLFCARVASMKGASVAVVENQAENGYARGAGGDVGTVNSQYMLDQGAPRIDEAEFLREYARRCVIRHNPRRISYFVKNSGKILDWVIKDMSKEWLTQNCHGMSCPPRPDVLLDVSGWKFYFGTAIFRNMGMNNASEVQGWQGLLKLHQEKAMADGAKWFYGHHAEICDLDSSGAVTGVVAKRADGKYVRFKARKGVALCAGDFSGNREMVRDILDQLRHLAEAQGDADLVTASGNTRPIVRDGSGIRLGIWAGGHIEIGPRTNMGDGDPGTGAWYLQLDGNGERFCDEAAGTMLCHPIGSVVVTLYDANWKKALGMQPPRHMGPDTSGVDFQTRLSHLDNLKPGPMSKSQQGFPGGGGQSGLPSVSGMTCCANTIEELLDYMDCYKGEARKKALAEITRYNQMCEKGVDEDFGKDPRILKVTSLKDPLFYATVSTYTGRSMMGGINAGMCVTTGLDTDAEGHVLNSKFEPIKGLYAAGNNAGGRYIVVYQSPFAGISNGMAMTDGYLLGERLAAI
jgi:fumarate reductase flavoprotein subunit